MKRPEFGQHRLFYISRGHFLSELEKDNNESNERIKALEEAIVKASNQIAELESKEATIKAEMEQMNGGRDETADEREALSAKLTELKLSSATNERDIQSAKTAVVLLKNAMTGRLEQTQKIDVDIQTAKLKEAEFEQDIVKLEQTIEEAKKSVADKQAEVEAKLNRRTEIEASSSTLRQSEKDKTSERERVNGELERLKAKKEAMTEELDDIVRRLYDEYELTRSEAENMGIEIENPQEAKKSLSETKSKIKSLGNVNVAAIEEYKEVSERFEFLSAQVDDVEKTKAELIRLIGDLTEQMKTMFMEQSVCWKLC